MAEFISAADTPALWVMAGDMNATLDPSESSLMHYQENAASAEFRWFLHEIGASDAWNEQDDCEIGKDFTHRLDAPPHTLKILDRVAHSFRPEEVTVRQRGFVSGTDH